MVAPACSPTRAALLTGRDHLLTGVWGVPPRANLRPDEARLPAWFKAAGYRTMHVGKLDCVKVGKSGPTTFGWDDWLGGGGYEHRDPMIFQPRNNRRGQGWTVDLWTDYALGYLREHRGEPWFASVAYIIPHLPWECPEEYRAPFLAQGCSPNLAACYGSISHLDAAIGRLLAGLAETGQEERTIVIFLSDNGPTSPEVKQPAPDGQVPGEDWPKRNVAGLRGHKALVWENGDRVPLLVRWPGRLAPGDRRQFGCVEDVLPTVLELAGIAVDSVHHQPLTGVRLTASLADSAATIERPEAFRIAIAGEGAPRNLAAGQPRRFEDHHLTLRGPRFKYHARPGGRTALYDLEADLGETTDVSARYPEVAAEMAATCRVRWDALLASGRGFAPPDASPAPG